MASVIQQISPVAHLPLVLGVARTLQVAAFIIPSALHTPRMASRVAVGARCYFWRFWMVIMLSIR
jgi:hypothetical protein